MIESVRYTNMNNGMTRGHRRNKSISKNGRQLEAGKRAAGYSGDSSSEE